MLFMIVFSVHFHRCSSKHFCTSLSIVYLPSSYTFTVKRRGKIQYEVCCTKKWHVEYTTFQKWQCDLDHEYQTRSWLDCNSEKGGRKVVAKLRCEVCTEFLDRIKGRKNFSDRWILGINSMRISNVCNHTWSDQHAHVMSVLKEQHSASADMGP